MSFRTIEAPGIELKERYNFFNNLDTSLPNSPICFLFGFADKGINYSIEWINSKETLINTYGFPTNELEQFFYNGCLEILNKKGKLLTCKLPYFNVANDYFPFVEYTCNLSSISNLDENLSSELISKVAPYLNKILKIESKVKSGKISLSEFDNLKTNIAEKKTNTIKIVDISKQQYKQANFNCVSSWFPTNSSSETDSFPEKTNEILGIVPIIVSPINALYFQNLINYRSNSVSNLSTVTIETFNMPFFENEKIEPGINVGKFFEKNQLSVDLSDLSSNLFLNLSSENLNDESVSKKCCEYFPLIDLTSFDEKILNKFFKKIGIVVLNAFADNSLDGKINFSVLESFVGSLDPTEKNPIDNSSFFIDNIVNNNSNYINVFSNLNQNILKSTDIIDIENQNAVSLGFYCLETMKRLNVKDSFINPINKVLENLKDTRNISIDLLIDGGISNLAQFTNFNMNSVFNGNPSFQLTPIIGKTNKSFFSKNLESFTNEHVITWKQIINIFDNFCRNIRKDCLFIADGFRGFCLNSNEKIVRSTCPSNTVENKILPNLKYLTGFNSSYTTGYLNWFKTIDDFTKTYFWCPPSLKAAGIFCYTDTYFHPWSAPAGILRGKLSDDVVDIAFQPTHKEAGKIYNYKWNYAVSYPQDGIILEGQKTFQTNKTAFDRINVRRLMLYLEKTVMNIAKYFLYEQNTSYIRQLFVDSITPFFENAKDGGGIIDYIIKCDEENNTPFTIDNNELYCQIAVKPVKSIEYIVLSFTVTNQSSVVNENILR